MPAIVSADGLPRRLREDFFAQYRSRYYDPDQSHGVLMDRVHSIEIGEPIDWAFARFLVDTGAIDLTPWRDGVGPTTAKGKVWSQDT